MASTQYYLDTTVKITANIKLDTGILSDPTGLVFTMEDPSGTSTVVNYITPEPSGVNVIHRIDVGQYYIEWPSSLVGDYKFKYQATGNMGCAVKGTYQIRDINP